MNTIEATQPGADRAFSFDSDGVCRNPERIEVMMPKGTQCALFVAQQPDDAWTFGFICAGPMEPQKIEARILANGEASRELAIEAAASAAREFCGDWPEVVKALDDFAAGQLAAVPPLPGMAHAFGAATGDAVNPELVAVEGVPEKASIMIHLAQADDGCWRYGYEVKVGDIYGFEAANLAGTACAERAVALAAGLQDARVVLAEAKKSKLVRAALRALDEMEACESTAVSCPASAVRPEQRVYRTSFAELPVIKIQRSPENHRKHFDPVKLQELADSIRAEGLHQPIAVRRLFAGEQPEGELGLRDPGAPEYELIYGERRWRAMQLAGLPVVTAKVYEDLPRDRAHAIALIENLQREDINCVEEAEGYAALMAAEGLTQEQCAERIGKARSTIANCLRLLKLPDVIRGHLSDGALTLAHGVSLARFSEWPQHLAIIAEEVIRDEKPSSMIERGVPYAYKLCSAGLAVRISAYSEYKITDKLKKHPAYFASGDGDWICFDPAHWAAEVESRAAAKKAREEQERLKREAEVAKAAKSGRKSLKLSDLNPGDYRELDGSEAALVELVPAEKRAQAKDFDGKQRTIVTDVQLADRLKGAMMRAIKKNRREAIAEIDEKARKKISALKKVGARELAWLVYLLTDSEARRISLRLSAETAKGMGIKLPAAVIDDDELNWDEREARRATKLTELAKCDGVDLLKTLMAGRLASALEEIIELGPESMGANFIRWWLDTETLWLLEETEEGRAELVERVKNAPWYAKALAGETAEEDGE